MEADTPTISAHVNWLNPSLGTSQALLICCLTHGSSSQLRSIRSIRAFMGQLKAQLVLLHTLGQAGAAYPRLKHPGGLSPSSCPATPALLVAAQRRWDFGFAFPKDLRRIFSLLEGKP